MSEQRYRILGDDSGHQYFIPVEQEKLFELWLKTFDEDWDSEYEGPDFNENRIDGRFTFTDPRCS